MAETGSVTVTIDDEKIKERMREFLAEAWDEGWSAHGKVVWSPYELNNPVASSPTNPYRDSE